MAGIKMQNDDVEVFYINELISSLEAKRGLRPVKDVGNIQIPEKPRIGMDKINAKTNMGKYFVDFANTSTIHGLNHLSAPRRHPAEKFLAVLFILGALLCLIFLSLDFWRRYQYETTMLVLEYDFRKFKIARPSFFVCPEKPIDYDKFPDVFKKYNIEDTNNTRDFFVSLSNFDYENIPKLDPLFDAAPSNLWLKIIYELRTEVKMNANDYDWVVTERGLCVVRKNYVSFYLFPELWFTNSWKTPIETITNYDDFTMTFGSATNMGTLKGLGINFWLSIHQPGTVMEYASPRRYVRALSFASVRMEITDVSSTEKVKLLSVGQRNCKYLQDGGLKMWPIYTKNFCQMECRFNLMKKICGCIPHVAPPSDDTKVCNAQDLLCLHKNLKKFVPLDAIELKKCDCLEDCDYTTFTDKGGDPILLKEGSPNEGILDLSIDFPKEKFVREELFGYNDFLTSVGGAAGLFLGASVISFVEIFYFLTLRLFWDRVNLRKMEAKRKN